MKTNLPRAGKRLLFVATFVCACLIAGASVAKAARYGESYCADPNYRCITIQAQEREVEIKTRRGVKKVIRKTPPTWEAMWPDEREREIVKKVNRMNIKLRPDMVIAVPNNMAGKTFMDYSPYPKTTQPPGEKLLIWDPKLLAWAAYTPEGNLVRWGPGVGGRGYCGDVGRGCRTRVGTHKILNKKGPNCRSGKYPIRKSGNNGGAKMPWFMMFDSAGYGFHGSSNVPGYNASHGCVRLFIDDAQWLNQNFVDVGMKAIVRPYQ